MSFTFLPFNKIISWRFNQTNVINFALYPTLPFKWLSQFDDSYVEPILQESIYFLAHSPTYLKSELDPLLKPNFAQVSHPLSSKHELDH